MDIEKRAALRYAACALAVHLSGLLSHTNRSGNVQHPGAAKRVQYAGFFHRDPLDIAFSVLTPPPADGKFASNPCYPGEPLNSARKEFGAASLPAGTRRVTRLAGRTQREATSNGDAQRLGAAQEPVNVKE